MTSRDLAFDGCHNVRDLGGLPTADGRETRRGAVVRSDTPDRLTAAGWSALRAYGVRTLVDLRNDAEVTAWNGYRPPWVEVVRAPLDDDGDTEFWESLRHLYGTPLYYRAFLDRKPGRCAAAVAAIAQAPPGGVLFHCVAGRDRTGIVALVLLALAGVPPGDIAADYELTAERLGPLYAKIGEEDEAPSIRRRLAQAGTSAREIVSTLAAMDAGAYLLGGGLSPADLAAARARLAPPA
ncbi:tyrosine-protein phosphatase [Sphaerisporangium corydalis]|uniref:Tyrosine-protein phosphatase n=1 Tax=Sphaerisporangium corydalis TaxID=1441875 RepID=A0ABV9E8E4_9ACTN|nr:tyrosine-protein phosphatase [Sphaerisporangium corydalis]